MIEEQIEKKKEDIVNFGKWIQKAYNELDSLVSISKIIDNHDAEMAKKKT